MCFSGTVFADQSFHGPYIGAQAGYIDNNNTHAGHDTWADAFLPFLSDAAYRAYFGYRFNDYFALEGGYTSITDGKDTGGLSNKDDRYRIYGYDLVGKAIVPLALGFNVYIKAGGQYVRQNIVNSTSGQIIYQSKVNKLLPTVGIGGGWNMTKFLALDLSYTYTYGIGEIKSIEFAALGLTITIPGL